MRSLRIIRAFALNTFRETVRDRVLYAIIVFAFLATLSGLVFSSLSADQDIRVLEDLGLATITIFGGVIAVFIGTTLVFKEIDRRTIFLIVTKPISRWEFITGKFLGLSLCVLVTNFAMGLFFLLIIYMQTGNFDSAPAMFASLSMIYVELVLVIAMATFFSTFCTPLMSMLFTLGLWTVGHLSFSFEMLKKLAQTPEHYSKATQIFADVLYYVMPDLARLTVIRGDFMDGHFDSSGNLLANIVIYIVAYAVCLLSLASFIAEKKEFN